MSKKAMALVLAALLLALCGCENGGESVYVQSVKDLAAMGGIAPGDRFSGMVVSENVSQIQKDKDKAVKELLVKEGDDVKEGQILFSYDTEELQLSLDKKRLELEQLEANIANYQEQIERLERESARVSGSAKLEYTIQIQTNQLDLKEAEIKLKSKEAEVKQAENLLENADVVSPVTGRVQSISESGTDNNGKPMPYITIQKSGAYRIKAVLGELQRGGIQPGDRVRAVSRLDESLSWLGTVSVVDYESPTQGNPNNMYGNVDEMSNASRYPFYIDLDSTEGLMLGQHVYVELASEGEEVSGLQLGGAFVCYEEDGSTYVWAEHRGKLEKRKVTLGDYNEMQDTYIITEGLTEEDYVAFPDPEVCREGISTTHELKQEDTGDAGAGVDMGVDAGVDAGVDTGVDAGMEVMD